MTSLDFTTKQHPSGQHSPLSKIIVQLFPPAPDNKDVNFISLE